MANFLNAFCSNLSSVIHPLLQLTRKDNEFQWPSAHTSAFEAARRLIADAPFLAFFDQQRPVTLQVNASNYWLGGALLQDDSSSKLQPVVYMSCQLKLNKVQWAQIEKEALAICVTCHKWDLWLYGISVHSDHQAALETIFKKPLAKAPKCLQHITFRLQHYSIQVADRKWSTLVLADILSRAPLNVANDASPTNFDQFWVSVERQDRQPNTCFTASTAKARQHATKTDPSMQQLLQMVTTGWPSLNGSLPVCLTRRWSVRDELPVAEGIVHHSLQVVVPSTLRSSMLKNIHASQMGADSNYRTSRDFLYWPEMGMKSAVQDICSSCGQCVQYGAQTCTLFLTSDWISRKTRFSGNLRSLHFNSKLVKSLENSNPYIFWELKCKAKRKLLKWWQRVEECGPKSVSKLWISNFCGSCGWWGKSQWISWRMVQFLVEGRQPNKTTEEDFLEVLQVLFCKGVSFKGAQVDFWHTATKDEFLLHKIGVPAADNVPLLGLFSLAKIDWDMLVTTT